MNNEYKKILFKIPNDEEGFPGVNIEGIWGVKIEDGVYRIDNIPFYTSEATLGDEVLVYFNDEDLFFNAIKRHSLNSLIRVIMFDGNNPQIIRKKLRSLGCTTELYEDGLVISVNIPSEVSIESVRHFLDNEQSKDILDYEEAILRENI